MMLLDELAALCYAALVAAGEECDDEERVARALKLAHTFLRVYALERCRDGAGLLAEAARASAPSLREALERRADRCPVGDARNLVMHYAFVYGGRCSDYGTTAREDGPDGILLGASRAYYALCGNEGPKKDDAELSVLRAAIAYAERDAT